MYEDMYKDYSDISIWAGGNTEGETLYITEDMFPYDYPFSFKKANKQYLKPYPPVRAWWYYGETLDLTLSLTDENYIDSTEIPDVLDGFTFVVNFYNFRKELVFSKTFVPNELINNESELSISFNIDYDTSIYDFTRGIYFCGIEMQKLDEDGNIIDSTILLNRDDYMIRVI